MIRKFWKYGFLESSIAPYKFGVLFNISNNSFERLNTKDGAYKKT